MSRRHRVLLVAKNLQLGGTERQILRMLRAVDQDRFEVGLCTLDPESHYDGTRACERRFALDVGSDDPVAAIAACIDEFQPDVVHSFRDIVNRQVYQALARTVHQPTWLASVRGRPMLPQDIWGTFRFFHRAYRITVNSIGIAHTLRRFARVPASKIVVIPNLIDDRVAHPTNAQERQAARVARGLAHSGFVWILPGRLSWVKNQLGLLFALVLLKLTRRLPADTAVVLAGGTSDRGAARLIKGLAPVLGLRKYLRLPGAVKDVQSLYAAADGLVLPSWAEGMPNVVIEAQLAALPVVVSHQANRDGLVCDGDSGFVVRTGSPFALARALLRLMTSPELVRRRMGQRGREQILEILAPQPIIERLEHLYQEAALAFRGRGTPPVHREATIAGMA